jgi:hypothetical protein
MGEKPDCTGGGALTAGGDRCGVVAVSVDVEDVDIV